MLVYMQLRISNEGRVHGTEGDMEFTIPLIRGNCDYEIGKKSKARYERFLYISYLKI